MDCMCSSSQTENNSVTFPTLRCPNLTKIPNMKKYILLLLIPAFVGCKAIKTIKLFKKGEVAQQEFKAEVPFEFRLGLIILKVQIDGKTHEFVLDTGAPNVISRQLAAELNIKPTVSQKAKDSQGGNSDLGFAQIPDIVIGGIHFTNTGTAIADLKQSTEVGCLNIDGFIGSNLMKKAIWQFDYQKKIITITNTKNNLEIPASAKVIPFKQQITGTPMIDIFYNGAVDKNVTFDLGSNGNFGSSNKVLKEVKKQGKINTNYGTGNNDSGLFGQSAADTVTYGIVPEVKFGDLTLQSQVVSFTEKKARTIGTKIFENYRLIIDWTAEEITMIPVKEFDFAQLKTFGLSPQFKDNKLYIGFIYHGSNTEQQGIAIGDQILEVNGKDIRTCTIEQWCEFLNNGFFPADTETNTLRLLKNGEEKVFTLTKTVVLK